MVYIETEKEFNSLIIKILLTEITNKFYED
jgi:hypothetical protein